MGRETGSDCVRMCDCVLFCAKSVARSLRTLGFPSAPSLRESPAPALDLTRRTHHYPRPLCAAKQDPETLLSSCSTTNQLRQTTGCVSPDRLASRAECCSLCQPDYFGPDEDTRFPRHHALLSRVSRKYAQHLVSPRLKLILRAETILWWSAAELLPARRIPFDQSSSRGSIRLPCALLGWRNAHRPLGGRSRAHCPSWTCNGESLLPDLSAHETRDNSGETHRGAEPTQTQSGPRKVTPQQSLRPSRPVAAELTSFEKTLDIPPASSRACPPK